MSNCLAITAVLVAHCCMTLKGRLLLKSILKAPTCHELHGLCCKHVDLHPHVSAVSVERTFRQICINACAGLASCDDDAPKGQQARVPESSTNAKIVRYEVIAMQYVEAHWEAAVHTQVDIGSSILQQSGA